MDDDSWNNGTADVPVPLNGADLAEYEGPILRAVESCNSHNAGNLMLCFRKEWNPGVKEKVLSAIPSLEIRGGELMALSLIHIYRTFISNLRLLPELKWASLGDLYRMENKEKYPLKEWEEAVSYLLGCEVRFNNYEEIGKSLKPFSLEVK